MTEINNSAERRLLQFVIAFAALVPILAGVNGVVKGGAMFDPITLPPVPESHYRYLSGILLAIGLSFWKLLPNIETATAQVRLLTYLVVIGGLARLIGSVSTSLSTPVILALLMELAVTPFLCIWQSRVAQRCRRR